MLPLILKIHLNSLQLTLPNGVGQQSVDITIQWVGQDINHPIDAATPVSGKFMST